MMAQEAAKELAFPVLILQEVKTKLLIGTKIIVVELVGINLL